MKPTGIFNDFFKAHKRSMKPKEVMSGNLKKPHAMRSITMQFTEDQIERMEKESLDLDIMRNKYVNIALEHYWSCKKK